MFSVIIPNFNQKAFIRDAIGSVLAQSCPDYEIIVVDDGSTDGSKAVVDEFGPRVRYIRQENQGLAGARNTGIYAAKGELIALLDADDQWRPTYLEEMSRLINAHPDATAFYCMAQCMDVHGHDLPQHVGGPPADPAQLYWKLLRADFIIPSTVIFRGKPIMDAGAFDSSLRQCEDWDLWFRLLPTQKVVGSSSCLVRYRVHGGSLSTDVEGMITVTRRIVEKKFGSEDGAASSWTPEKQRAYGGVYRYQCIMLVQRQNDWEACLPSMVKALQTDPSLALDLDFFYELALGTQPVGYRGASELQGFNRNAAHLQRLMLRASESLSDPAIRKQALGTTYFALGLVSYNWGIRSTFRDYFRKALRYRPDLMLNASLVARYFKSFVRKNWMMQLKDTVGHRL